MFFFKFLWPCENIWILDWGRQLRRVQRWSALAQVSKSLSIFFSLSLSTDTHFRPRNEWSKNKWMGGFCMSWTDLRACSIMKYQFWSCKSLDNIRKLCKIESTGGPRISWFLVPKGNHEMRGSWIPRTVFSVKPQNGSKSFLKSTFWAFFHEILIFSPIEIAAFSSLLLHAY